MEDTINIIANNPLDFGRIIILLLPFTLMFITIMYNAYRFNTYKEVYRFGNFFDRIVRGISVLYIGTTLVMLVVITIVMFSMSWSLEQKISALLILTLLIFIQPWHAWKPTKKTTLFMVMFFFTMLASVIGGNLLVFSLNVLQRIQSWVSTIIVSILFITVALIVLRSHQRIAPILQKIGHWSVTEVNDYEISQDENVLKTHLIQPLSYVLTILKCIMGVIVVSVASQLLISTQGIDTNVIVFLIAAFSAHTYLVKYQQKLKSVLKIQSKKRYHRRKTKPQRRFL